MTIHIRLVETHAEYRAVEQLQRAVWGMPDDSEVVPLHMLVTAQKNGGLVLGAFDDEAPGGPLLVGFTFGFLGRGPDGRQWHCSHMTGVAPGCRDRNVGFRLKLAQREHVLAQGLDLVVWTFDPLQSRNAYLNFHKLGATCRTYWRDLYGELREDLNAGLPTDRLRVDWRIAEEHVRAALGGTRARWTLAALRAGDTELAPGPPSTAMPDLKGGRLLVEIPADFQGVKAVDMALAGAWRQRARAVFEAAFAAGYTAVDSLQESGRSYVLLER